MITGQHTRLESRNPVLWPCGWVCFRVPKCSDCFLQSPSLWRVSQKHERKPQILRKKCGQQIQFLLLMR